MKLVYRVKYRELGGEWMSTGDTTKKDAQEKAELLKSMGYETEITVTEDVRYA